MRTEPVGEAPTDDAASVHDAVHRRYAELAVVAARGGVSCCGEEGQACFGPGGYGQAEQAEADQGPVQGDPDRLAHDVARAVRPDPADLGRHEAGVLEWLFADVGPELFAAHPRERPIAFQVRVALRGEPGQDLDDLQLVVQVGLEPQNELAGVRVQLAIARLQHRHLHPEERRPRRPPAATGARVNAQLLRGAARETEMGRAIGFSRQAPWGAPWSYSDRSAISGSTFVAPRAGR